MNILLISFNIVALRWLHRVKTGFCRNCLRKSWWKEWHTKVNVVPAYNRA